MLKGKARVVVGSLGAGVTTVILWSGPALAQEPSSNGSGVVPDPGPNASIPGNGLIVEVLGWLKFGALAAAVAGILAGGIAMGVGYSGSHYGASAAGRRWLLGGMGAAIVAGLAHTVAITLYEAT
jgi:hypothetical protein